MCKKTIDSGLTVKTKRKELSVKNFLESNSFPIEAYDKRVTGGCSKKRPDILVQTEWGNIILEIDENQHKSKTYNCYCEIVRMKQLYFDVGTERLLIVRYNPDNYRPSYGKIFSETERLRYLLKTLQKYFIEPPKYNCTVLYLFYDGFSHAEEEIDGIDPYEIRLIIYRDGGKFVIERDGDNDWLIETE
jgi:hypothetical protein